MAPGTRQSSARSRPAPPPGVGPGARLARVRPAAQSGGAHLRPALQRGVDQDAPSAPTDARTFEIRSAGSGRWPIGASSAWPSSLAVKVRNDLTNFAWSPGRPLVQVISYVTRIAGYAPASCKP